MTLDPATQAISRFVGLFELIVEESRLRQDLLKFKLKKAPDAPDQFLPGISARLTVGEQIEGYDPGLHYRPTPPPSNPLEAKPVYSYTPVHLPLYPVIPFQDQDWSLDPDQAVVIIIEPPAYGFVDGPGSVVAVAIQIASLADDDLLLDGMGASFTPIATLDSALERIDAIADGLKGFELPAMPATSGWMSVVKAVIGQIDAAGSAPPDAGSVPAADIVVHHGSDAQGLFADGAAVSEAPDWSDLLPAYLRPAAGTPKPPADPAPSDQDEDDEDEAAASSGVSASHGETISHTTTGVGGTSQTHRSDDHDYSRDFPDRQPNGDTIPGNEIVSGANTAINEIGVGSQWIDASVIVVRGDVAKIHAISQVNVLVEHDTLNGVAVAQESAGLNIAEISASASAADGAAAADGANLPSGWQLYRLDGDLYQINWVKQVTFVTDFDRAEVSFSAQMTFLGLGENQIVNSTILNEFGYRFDLMVVAGDMIDATLISQKNVLFDSDRIETATPAATAGTGGPDQAASLSLADNLLYNKASITATGIDSFATMSESFAKAADDLAAGKNALAADLVKDKLFAGQETLNALQIAGDLVKLNVFEQENIVGDADQLRLELQQMRDDFAAEVKLVAGSNALVNIATIREHGIDSTIMAGGKIYDDALIHQAEWFDTDARSEGVAMAALTKDAVAAFLSDELAKIDNMTDAITPIGSYDSGTTLDVMQSVLA